MKTSWNCLCDCGNTCCVQSKNLRNRKTISCGCKRKEKNREALLGQRFGHLTVIAFDHCEEDKDYRMYWRCKCDCGNEKVIDGHTLRKGGATTCGSCRALWNGPRVTDERLYNVYRAMKERCYSTTNENYKHYGGRGISICDEWQNDYNTFKKWAYEAGYDESAPYGELTIDRIDVNGNYCPENCRWVDMRTQTLNKRDTVYCTIDGITKPLSIWCEEYNIRRNTVEGRIKRGWSEKDAITTPVGSKTNKTWEKKLTCNGVTRPTGEWVKESGVPGRLILSRIRNGWTVKDAIFTPTRTAQKFTHDGKSLTMDEWSIETGIKSDTIWHRLKHGYTFDEAITMPLQKRSETAQMADLLD